MKVSLNTRDRLLKHRKYGHSFDQTINRVLDIFEMKQSLKENGQDESLKHVIISEGEIKPEPNSDMMCVCGHDITEHMDTGRCTQCDCQKFKFAESEEAVVIIKDATIIHHGSGMVILQKEAVHMDRVALIRDILTEEDVLGGDTRDPVFREALLVIRQFHERRFAGYDARQSKGERVK